MGNKNILISKQTFEVLLMLDKDALFSAIHSLNFELFGAGDKDITPSQDNAKIAVFLMKNETEKNWQSYETKCKQSAERVKKWRAKMNVTQNNECNALQRVVTECNNRIEENRIEENRIEENRVNGNSVVLVGNIEKENIIKEKEKRHVFQKPTITEIESYVKENQYSVNAAKFFDFYESKGWFVGKNKMKDWRAAVRTWQRDERKDDKKRAARVDTDFNSTF